MIYAIRYISMIVNIEISTKYYMHCILLLTMKLISPNS